MAPPSDPPPSAPLSDPGAPSAWQAKLDARLSAIMRMPLPELSQAVREAQKGTRFGGDNVISIDRGREAVVEALDTFTEAEVARVRARGPAPLVFGIDDGDDGLEASVFIWHSGDVDRLRALGARVRSEGRGIVTATVTLDAMERLAADPTVRLVEIATPMTRTLDTTVREIGAKALHDLNPSLTGKGVVIGVVDVDGIDIFHPDFSVEEGGEARTRLISIWDQRAGYRRPQGDVPYGTEWTAAQIDQTLKSHGFPVTHRADCDKHPPSHGTHMTGIAAGNGRAESGKYRGVAPDAALVFVNTFDSGVRGFADMTHVADALHYISRRAGNRPCVINLSLGDPLGAHDGSSALERFIDDLVETPGRIVVVSAGNDNNARKHLEAPIPEDARVFDLVVPPRTGAAERLQIWYPRDERLDVTLSGPGARVLSRRAPSSAGTRVTIQDDADVRIEIHSTAHAVQNGENLIDILFIPHAGKVTPAATWRVELRRQPRAGAPDPRALVHAWIDTNSDICWYRAASDRGTLATPATARGAITVGFYMSDVNGKVSKVSGRGPTRDGRQKPDFVAPGGAFAPNASPRAVDRRSPYERGVGTSQAAAHVTGAVALLLQALGPGLDAGTAKEILKRYADRTGLNPGWDAAYGFGRVRLRHEIAPAAPADDSPSASELP